MRMRVAAMLLGAAGFAGAANRPLCSSTTRGMIWPPGNTSTEHSRRCEEVSMCTPAFFRHRWEVVRLPYWKLSGAAAPEACRSNASVARSGAQSGARNGEAVQMLGGAQEDPTLR